MARARVRSRGTGFEIGVDVDVERTSRALREVRRDVARDLDQVLALAAGDVVLPEAKRRASGLKVEGTPVASTLVVRRRRNAPYMTTRFRGRKARAAGLLEFGGVVRTEIVPRRKQAVVVNGQPVARVTKARHYRAHRFMTESVDAKLDVFAARVRDLLVQRFAAHGFEVR